MSTLLTAIKLILASLSGLGFYLTWYLAMNNGSFDFMANIRDHGPRILPYTDKAPLRTQYTGIELVDNQLTVLTLFFFNIVDGSHPNACLQAYHFGGQIISGWSLLILESLRWSNRSRIVSFVAVWGFMVQNAAFAVVIPLYFVTHLSTSPTVSSKKQTDLLPTGSIDLSSLPYSVALGFVLPSIAMALPAPSVVSYERKQLFIAIWQVFPIWIALLQQIIPYLRRCFMKTFIIENEVYKRRTIGTMRTAYMTMLTVATVTRVSAWTVPISSFLFPSIFAPDAVNSLTPSSVFKPAAVTASVKMPSLAASSILFLQHDEIVGSAAVVIWSLALYLNTTGKKTMGDWISLMVKGTGIAAVAGPQGFAVAAIWARDEIIFAIDQTEKKKR